MSYLYRTAVLIARKQPFIDWANGLDDGGPEFTEELARTRDVYLGPDCDTVQTLDQALDAIWEDVFEEELFGWCTDESTWPQTRTRDMFNAWFDAELAESIIDLVPEDPLTETDMDVVDLEEALNTCGWCGAELAVETGRMVAFRLPDRTLFEEREGRVLDLIVKRDRVVRAVVTPRDSEPAQAEADLIVRACSRACEKHIQRTVPHALRELEERLAAVHRHSHSSGST